MSDNKPKGSIFAEVEKFRSGGAEKPKPMAIHKTKVLVVDDNAILLRTVKEMIGSRYQVSIAASASQAFTAISKSAPDIILLDYEMPYTNGVEMLKKLRSSIETMNIPVIFFTSSAEREIVAKIVEYNPDGYLLKPPNKEKMIAIIDKTLAAKNGV